MENVPLRCVAIDDEPPALELVANYARRLPMLELVRTFEDAISGAEFLAANPVDLVFLDIDMPDISGLDLAKALVDRPMVIFITAHRNFALDGFELEAIDYLLKPVDFERFSRAVAKAAEFKKYRGLVKTEQSPGHIFVQSEYRTIKIEFRDIEYIESMEDYVKFHTSDGKMILSLMSLKKVNQMLPENDFKRIHRSFIIPVSKIKSFQGKRIDLGEVTLPVGESYSEQVKTWLKKS